jgi:hypothetical protein
VSVKDDNESRRLWLTRGDRARQRKLDVVSSPKNDPGQGASVAWLHPVPDFDDAPVRSTHALSVRLLCPFCGSTQDADGEACCADWAASSGDTSDDTRDAVAQSEGRPRFVRAFVAAAARLNEASQLLVMLVASSTIAMLVSLATQSRFIVEDALMDAAPVRAGMLPMAVMQAIAKPAPNPPVRVEAPPAIVEAPPADAPPSDEPPVVVASLSPSLPRAAVPPYHSIDIVGPQPPTSGKFRPGSGFGDASRWEGLRRGMSRTAVRMIFGYPNWIDRHTTPNTEYWLYASDRLADGAWIAFFDNDGPVADWRRP